MRTFQTASSINNTKPSIPSDPNETDSFWTDPYPPTTSVLVHSSSPTRPIIKPPPHEHSASGSSAKGTPFPLIQQTIRLDPSPSSALSPKSQNTNTNHKDKDKLAPIYPSESLPGLSEWNIIDSPAKTVRFAHTQIYHSSDSINRSIGAKDYRNTSSTTATTLTRTNPDPKLEIKRNLKEQPESQSISDPNRSDSADKGISLRGDILRRKMSSRSNGKRLDRENSQNTRTKEFNSREGREYGPSNIPRPIRPAAKDLEHISRVESSLILQAFTTTDAWALGCALRDRLIHHDKPTLISITLSSGQVLFHCCTKSGTTIDHSVLLERKRNSVLRFGVSTWYLSQKYGADESLFTCKNGLGEREKGKFSIVGGGLPIRVRGVEGVVAVVLVGGLKGEENHEVIVETIQEYWY